MKILKAIYSLFEALGEARAAAYFARTGQIDKAKSLYSA